MDDEKRKQVRLHSERPKRQRAAVPADKDAFLNRLKKDGGVLDRSVKHHTKFHANKHNVVEKFPMEMRYASDASIHAALVLTDLYAYL